MKLKLKTPPASEPVTLAQVLTQLRLDITSPELATGTLTIGTWYLITSTAANAFYTGCAIGDTFKAAAATALTASNKVREIYEGAHLNSLIVAAREYVENLCGPLITQSWYQYHDTWPYREIILGKPRVASVVAVKYTEYGEAAATFDSSNYSTDFVDPDKCRIVLDSDASWPSITLEDVNPIEIEFTCGYGATWASLPENIRLAMLLHITNRYWNRIPDPAVEKVVEDTITNLVINYRWWGC